MMGAKACKKRTADDAREHSTAKKASRQVDAAVNRNGVLKPHDPVIQEVEVQPNGEAEGPMDDGRRGSKDSSRWSSSGGGGSGRGARATKLTNDNSVLPVFKDRDGDEAHEFWEETADGKLVQIPSAQLKRCR
ncbi:unnamed protein product [Vitrella brassicaformis CCMP3155]|uniref:Uncharacterized protein n=2 Tax=Vitrella brassicaformis TaxID=1169539 RepID=A0A0G4EPM5_VITBC|nr:unnamed protein product [Vitrella brassicaformis CCMP3155]|mmetsp:Transcript_2624/g.5936  ORF Transcript_2624/g.5936 Transcript_2624/m.5936 type:complete len:133 (+) Transcript_2624:276-674(+)|eukprot:CEL99417.1 unnamed protein product [Vitrella brassicaformis CCMP3155]